MNKKHCFLMYALAFCITFGGCQAAPQKVIENAKKYGENNRKEADSVTFCNISELQSVSINKITVKDTNIVLPQNIDFSGVENVYDLKLKFEENYTSQKEEFESFFRMSGNKEYKESVSVLKGYTGISIRQESEKRSLLLLDNGLVSFRSGCLFDYSYELDNTPIKKIYLQQMEAHDETILFPSGRVTLSQVINDFNKWYSEGPFDHNFLPYVRTAYILPLRDGNNLVSLSAMLEIDGVFLDFYGAGFKEIDVGVVKVNKMANFANVSIIDRNDYVLFMNNGSLRIMEKKAIDQIVDFQSAVNILCEKMAGFNRLEIVEVEPIYIMDPEYSPEENEYYGAQGNIVTTVPVYSFLVKFDSGTVNNQYYDIIESNDFCYINISMIDGSISTNLNERGYMYR